MRDGSEGADQVLLVSITRSVYVFRNPVPVTGCCPRLWPGVAVLAVLAVLAVCTVLAVYWHVYDCAALRC